MMFQEIWRLIRRMGWLASGLLLFFVAAEFFRIYLMAYRLAPMYAYGFLAAILLATLITLRMLRGAHPIPRPPPTPGPEASFDELHRYVRYLPKALRACTRAGPLPEELQAAAEKAVAYIRDVLRAHPLKDDLRMAITKAEASAFQPLREFWRADFQEELLATATDVCRASLYPLFSGTDFPTALVNVLRQNAEIVETLAGHMGPWGRLRLLRDSMRPAFGTEWHDFGARLATEVGLPPGLEPTRRALSAAWFAIYAAHAAFIRCDWSRRWSPDFAAARLEEYRPAMMELLKTVMRELPKEAFLLRNTAAPEAGAGAPAQTVVNLESAMHKLGAPPKLALGPRPANLPGAKRRETAVEPDAGPDTPPPPARHHAHRHRSFRTITTFGQRIKYTLLARWIHR